MIKRDTDKHRDKARDTNRETETKGETDRDTDTKGETDGHRECRQEGGSGPARPSPEHAGAILTPEARVRAPPGLYCRTMI